VPEELEVEEEEPEEGPEDGKPRKDYFGRKKAKAFVYKCGNEARQAVQN
jgi:hypothetical protein